MKKVMVCMLLAMAAPAFAGNLDLADAIPWKAVTGRICHRGGSGQRVFKPDIPLRRQRWHFLALARLSEQLISICGCCRATLATPAGPR